MSNGTVGKINITWLLFLWHFRNGEITSVHFTIPQKITGSITGGLKISTFMNEGWMIKIKASLLLITRPLSSIKIIKLHNAAALKTRHLKKVTECNHWWSCLPVWQSAYSLQCQNLPENRATKTQHGPGLFQITTWLVLVIVYWNSVPGSVLSAGPHHHQNHLNFHRDGFWHRKTHSMRHLP